MTVAAGQIIYVKGTETPEYQTAQVAGKDGWDRWNDERDYAIANAEAWQHTNRFYTGSEDLDRYGDWVQVPGYDWCWMPYVDANWVPYRNGRWVSDPYYQWTWVGYEPWGWTPYHYGRWLFYEGNWCWWPAVGTNAEAGSGAPRPAWSPGNVAFIGLGGQRDGSGLPVGFDSIGWCPLGPRDPFRPWWGPNRSISTTDVAENNLAPASSDLAQPPYGSNLQGMLTDPHLRAAVTTLSVYNFSNGRIGDDVYPVNEAPLQQGSVIQGALPVSPAKDTFQSVNRPVNRAALPPGAEKSHHFFILGVEPSYRPSGPAAQVSPLENRQPALVTTPGRGDSAGPATRQDAASPRQESAIGTLPPKSKPDSQQAGTQSGWRHFTFGDHAPQPPTDPGKPASGEKQKSVSAPPGAQPRPTAPAQGSEGGWQHFGSPSAPAHRRVVPDPNGHIV